MRRLQSEARAPATHTSATQGRNRSRHAECLLDAGRPLRQRKCGLGVSMRTTKISTRSTWPPQEHQSERTTERRDDRSGDALLTVHDVAALLHVPVSWVYEHTSRRGPD